MLIKAMILILVAAFAGLFFVKGPNGEVILTLDDFKPDVPKIEAAQTPAKVYRWQDENGIWQFSNQPVDENQGEVIELDGNINTMPAVNATPLNKNSVAKKPAGMNIPSGFTTVPSEQVEEMMNTVNNLQDTVDSRKEEMDKLTGGNQ
jgi:hypothetical protein